MSLDSENPDLVASIKSLSILVKSLEQKLETADSRLDAVEEKQNSSDLRLDAVEERYTFIEKEVSQVMDRNQELSWVACHYDTEGKSCEDYLQASE
jgi:predicted  nucleic acid-binding Zn-ribbon protein